MKKLFFSLAVIFTAMVSVANNSDANFSIAGEGYTVVKKSSFNSISGNSLPFVENFETVTADEDINLSGWQNNLVVGQRKWIGKEYNQNKYAQFSSYNSEEANEAWLITPAVNLDASENEEFSFDVKVGFYNHTCLSVLISSDGGSNWEDITSNFTLPTEPTQGYGDSFVGSGTMDLSSYTGNVQIAFKYVGDGTDSKTTTYQIDNVEITGTTVSINDVTNILENVSVYPNPANDFVIVDNAEYVTSVIVKDISGKVVKYSLNKGNSKIQINVSDFNEGIYIISLVSDKGVRTEKIIVK